MYLVTGGKRDSNNYLSSTEQLVKDGTEWILTEKSLPARMLGLGSIYFNNQIFTTGKKQTFWAKLLFLYKTNYSFYLQEDMMQIPVFTLMKFSSLIQTRGPSTSLANWNKEGMNIQWVLLTLMILFVSNFEHVHDFFKHVFYLICFGYKNIVW